MSSLFSLENKVAVVTGGLGLLGQQFTSALIEQGARVAIIDQSKTPVKTNSTFEDFVRKGMIKLYSADVTQKKQLEVSLEQIQKDLGCPEILINNAAIDSPPNSPPEENGPFETYPEQSLDKILSVNLKGPFLCCQVFGNAMAQKGKGSIINIASIYGLLSPQQDIYAYKRKNGDAWFKPAPYAITKSGILNFTRYLATYWAKSGVRVNTLTPAGIFNNQDPEFLEEYQKRIPMGRMAHPHEMNGAVVFLASDASSYMTGANLVVDGGWTAW